MSHMDLEKKNIIMSHMAYTLRKFNYLYFLVVLRQACIAYVSQPNEWNSHRQTTQQVSYSFQPIKCINTCSPEEEFQLKINNWSRPIETSIVSYNNITLHNMHKVRRLADPKRDNSKSNHLNCRTICIYVPLSLFNIKLEPTIFPRSNHLYHPLQQTLQYSNICLVCPISCSNWQ